MRPLGLRADVLDLDLHAAWEQDPSLPVLPEAPAPWLARARDIALDVELRAEQPALDFAGLAAGSGVLRGELKGDPSRPLGFVLAGIDDLRVQLPPAVADLLRVLQGAGEVEMADVPQPGEVVLVGGSGVPRARSAEAEPPRMFGPCDGRAAWRSAGCSAVAAPRRRVGAAAGRRGQVSRRWTAAAAGGAASAPDAALAPQGALDRRRRGAGGLAGDVRSLQGHGDRGRAEGTAARRTSRPLRISTPRSAWPAAARGGVAQAVGR
jgi:hypothetical protein